ncbi:MAG TPA: PH domain-containing protein [Candidatus Acidoferrum sp.]|nr:PH domain-containing protein [Candidatus Acidoferrum sp.]
MSYAEKHLIAGETVQYETRLHWIVMLGHVLIAAVLVLIGVSLLLTPWSSVKGGEASLAGALRWAGAVCLVVAAIFFGVGLVRRNATEMAVTNKRVIVKSGLANRRTIELLLPRIESIAVEEPALGRLLGYGTVIVRGTGGTPEVFSQIARPLEFREQVQRQIAGEPKSS